MSSIILREAVAGDIATMRAFIFEHGVNQWNYLPEDDVAAHLDAIASGDTRAVIAEIEERMAGFLTFMNSRALARYQTEEQRRRAHGYVCEAVVHREHAGKGIGSMLLRDAIAKLAAQGFKEIYIERHEENLASAGMMHKAGFVEIDTFDDLQRRTSGSRRTTVCRFICSS